MPSIEDEIKKLRVGLMRSLAVIGVVTLGAILYVKFGGNQSSGLLADIANNVPQDIPIAASSSPSLSEATAPVSTSSPAQTTNATTTGTATAVTPVPVAVPSADPVTTPTTTPAIGPADTEDESIVATATDEAATSTQEIAAGEAPSSTSPITIPITPPTTISTTLFAAAPAPSSTVTVAPANIIEGLPYLATSFAPGDEWEDWWGSFSESSGTLTVGAGTSTTGGGALLGGAGAWKDYTFQATLDWVKGESFGLLARYTPGDNYVACEFDEPSPGDVHMYLNQYTDGQATTLIGGDVADYNQIGGLNITASIAVQGAEGTCSFNGHSISNTAGGRPIEISGSGGIGFKTWDPSTDNSQIVVRSVSARGND